MPRHHAPQPMSATQTPRRQPAACWIRILSQRRACIAGREVAQYRIVRRMPVKIALTCLRPIWIVIASASGMAD